MLQSIHLFRWPLLLLLMAGALALASCAEDSSTSKDSSSSTDSDTSGGSSTGVSLQSAAYDSAAATALSTRADITDFRFCITQIKLTDASGTAVTDEDGSSAIEAIIGLVDVSDSAVATEWGVLDLPLGYELSRLDVEVHSDAENCNGEDFSLSFNDTPLTQDLEFRFSFDPAVPLDGGETLTLALANIASAILDAEAAGALNDEDITSYLEDVEGSGEEEPEDETEDDSTTLAGA